MITLDRLLDGLDVEVELLPGEGGSGRRPPAWRRDGWAVLEVDGGTTIRLSPHRLTIEPPSRQSRASGDRDRDRVVSGTARVRVTFDRAPGLFDELAEPLAEDLGPDDPVRASFEALLDELAEPRPGGRAVVEALLRQGLILFLRRAAARGPLSAAWLAGLEDGRLGRAIAAMHDRPAHCFTLAELAEVAGMSRSVFAARFASALMKSPIEFLKTLRLERAAELLARTDLPVKAVAAQVGYASRSAFTRAFVTRHGTGPSTFRMAARTHIPLRPVSSVAEAA